MKRIHSFMRSARLRRGLDGIARKLNEMASRTKRSARWLPYNLDVVVPALAVTLIAIVAAIMALHKAYDVVHVAARTYQKSNSIAVQRLYLGRADYLEYVPTLMRLNPGVAFALDKDGNIVSMAINNEELFPDLMMALHTLQSYKPGVAWEMVELCVRKCSEDSVARVSVKGFKQEIR